MEIHYSTLTDIATFVERSAHYFRMNNISRRELKILMPEWLLIAIKRVNRPGHFFEMAPPIVEAFAGIQVFDHYKDEIVIFYPSYWHNTERFQAQIFKITVNRLPC